MSARERRALSELLALFHAVNSGHVKGRNPYAFPAVKLANEVLTGDPLDGGFHVAEALDRHREADGKALIFEVGGCPDGCLLSYSGAVPRCVNCDTEYPEENG